MAEQKLYAVRLKDGTWWQFDGDLYVTTDPLDYVQELLAEHVKAGSAGMEGAVAIPAAWWRTPMAVKPMRPSTRRFAPAIGFPHGNHVKAVVALEAQTFEEVRARAERAGHSFAQEVRQLIEVGLEECLNAR